MKCLKALSTQTQPLLQGVTLEYYFIKFMVKMFYSLILRQFYILKRNNKIHADINDTLNNRK